jgi:hypothetical protein
MAAPRRHAQICDRSQILCRSHVLVDHEQFTDLPTDGGSTAVSKRVYGVKRNLKYLRQHKNLF